MTVCTVGTSTLTSVERVNRMFARLDHDRIPRHESFWPETLTRWQGEGLNGDQQTVLDLLGSDFWSLNWTWPAIFPGEDQTISEDHETRVVRDSQGKLVRYWKHKSGTPEHLGFECDSREVWERKYKPALLSTGLQLDPDAIRRRYLRGRAMNRWTFFNAVESFEETRGVMGDEITMIAMAEDPEWVRDVSMTFTDQMIRNLDAAMATGIQPDGVWLYGDMAFKTATFCSPAMYRELIWPDHKRLADWAHAHRMKLIYHTDGNVNGVMDLYREAGFDALQPLECKAGMDIRDLCPTHGQHMAFIGNIDVMKMMTNDLELIEQEIIAKFAAGKSTRGYCYHSDHSVPPQVSWQTYQTIMELVARHGSYH